MQALAEKQHASGKIFRTGVPNGWGRLKHLVNRIHAEKLEEGKRIVARMVELKMIDDNETANEMLAHLVGFVRDETVNVGEKIKAARTVLEYTKTKPVAKSEVVLNTAEDLLDRVLKDAG